MRRSVALLGVLAAFLLAASGCSGDDEAPDQATAGTSTTLPEGVSIFLTAEVVRRIDSREEGITGETVVMRPKSGGRDIRMVTQRAGHFSKRNMPSGTYEVILEGLEPGQTFEPTEFTVSGSYANVFGPHVVVSD